MRTSALLGAKNFGFFEIYGVSKRKRDLLWMALCSFEFLPLNLLLV